MMNRTRSRAITPDFKTIPAVLYAFTSKINTTFIYVLPTVYCSYQL